MNTFAKLHLYSKNDRKKFVRRVLNSSTESAFAKTSYEHLMINTLNEVPNGKVARSLKVNFVELNPPCLLNGRKIIVRGFVNVDPDLFNVKNDRPKI